MSERQPSPQQPQESQLKQPSKQKSTTKLTMTDYYTHYVWNSFFAKKINISSFGDLLLMLDRLPDPIKPVIGVYLFKAANHYCECYNMYLQQMSYRGQVPMSVFSYPTQFGQNGAMGGPPPQCSPSGHGMPNGGAGFHMHHQAPRPQPSSQFHDHFQFPSSSNCGGGGSSRHRSRSSQSDGPIIEEVIDDQPEPSSSTSSQVDELQQKFAEMKTTAPIIEPREEKETKKKVENETISKETVAASGGNVPVMDMFDFSSNTADVPVSKSASTVGPNLAELISIGDDSTQNSNNQQQQQPPQEPKLAEMPKPIESQSKAKAATVTASKGDLFQGSDLFSNFFADLTKNGSLKSSLFDFGPPPSSNDSSSTTTTAQVEESSAPKPPEEPNKDENYKSELNLDAQSDKPDLSPPKETFPPLEDAEILEKLAKEASAAPTSNVSPALGGDVNKNVAPQILTPTKVETNIGLHTPPPLTTTTKSGPNDDDAGDYVPRVRDENYRRQAERDFEDGSDAEQMTPPHERARRDPEDIDPLTACVFCPEWTHSSADCPAYKSAYERLERANGQFRCLKCLRKGHRKDACPNLALIGVCNICGLQHLAFLFH